MYAVFDPFFFLVVSIDEIRRADISDDLVVALHDLKRTREEQWLAKGKNEVPEWVFCNQEGHPADMQNVKNRHFKKCLTKAGLRTIRFHDCDTRSLHC